ncbi:16S rRNA (cytidine(1402)-2'-O)-methyltransferase [Actinomyces trachealis]|uniref:16S rRNA (cytidine(1402)-2'-O)-methyltransferase n=1 Tax=Actinomyces trachealis TaxID=2763540 RepID=UPI0018C7E9A2|nr:16S rRNA (cytidine(1402)-2'-O)-methyltransferase [Actinomyces trachealis]
MTNSDRFPHSEAPQPTDTTAIPRKGAITLAATPIGNTYDASPRLLAALQHADVVAAEDTRRALALASRLGVRIGGQLIAMHEHNERQRAPELITAAQAGQSVVLVTDAGMPSVSDPGYRVVEAALTAAVPVTVAPGPSAVLTALTLSGLASDRFCFEGFLPRRPGEQEHRLAALASEPRTMVFFESPRRVHQTLLRMAEALGEERAAAMCRELTKTYEEVRRATLGELAVSTETEVRGEVVLVVAGATAAAVSPEVAAQEALNLTADGMRLKEAAAQVARETGLRTNDVYRAAIAARS